MNCPACGNVLQEITVSDVVVDVCDGGCGGIWFDNYELDKFDEPHETADELLDIERDDSITVDHTKRLNCPKCSDVVMMRHFSSVKKEVVRFACEYVAASGADEGGVGEVVEKIVYLLQFAA